MFAIAMVHKMNTCFGYMINHTGYIADTKHKTIPDIRMIMGIIIWEKICSSSFTFFNLYLTSFYSFFTILTISRRLLPIRWQQSPAFQSYASIIECNRCHSLPKSTPPLFQSYASLAGCNSNIVHYTDYFFMCHCTFLLIWFI